MALLVGNLMVNTSVLKIGIAGFIGSGKSTVAKLVQEAGFEVIDADSEAHFLYATDADVRIALAEKFGPSVLTASGVDRTRLGKLVFADSKALVTLEEIIHPVLAKHLVKRIESESQYTQRKAVFVEGALLPKWPSLLSILNQVWDVQAPEADRVERIIQRGSSREDAESRIQQQRLFPALEHAQIISIQNVGDLNQLRQIVLQKLESL